MFLEPPLIWLQCTLIIQLVDQYPNELFYLMDVPIPSIELEDD